MELARWSDQLKCDQNSAFEKGSRVESISAHEKPRVKSYRLFRLIGQCAGHCLPRILGTLKKFRFMHCMMGDR